MTDYTIGIHNGHNSAVAVLEGDRLSFGIQEERLTRIKNQGGLPLCGLAEACQRFPLNEATEIRFGYGWERLVRGTWKREETLAHYGMTKLSPLGHLKNFVRQHRIFTEAIDERRAAEFSAEICQALGLRQVRLNRLNHHLCHAASAYYGWGKLNEKVLLLTCDGAGDGICASVNVGHGGRIERIAEVDYTHSIGRLYSNLTYLMGMVPLEHEYKIMGLAPYAEKARESKALADEFESMFQFEPNNPMVWRRNGVPPMRQAGRFLTEHLRLKRFDHVAGGLQIFIERFLVQWVRHCIAHTGIRKVALSGGVFMNVKANQRILDLQEVEELFVFPSCGDETNAIGSAWLLYYQQHGESPQPLQHFYLGTDFTNAEAEQAIKEYTFQNKVIVKSIPEVERRVAELLAAGQVVARFKGRMEFGARALGNRSILGNASSPQAVRVINEMIKCRDFWMPFAPSVLPERSRDYFVNPKGMPARYMIMTFDTRPEKREKIIAAIHPYDFTGRPQEVMEETNPDYYRLLKHYEDITGEGVILNTSFNLHGEPVVGFPKDALRVFDVSGLQHLAIQDFLISKA